ncbi:tripartite tricarboxylate transporter TctB family protein [Actinoalloteichus hymeniacidonis]|uniref:Tripartite tricarboxylate transporter TctB family n=1 Tax=Actinoalloteichus hymeniacidonis TaxID=340345 RepID=A0AAC9HV18_9PSEU|nr:tripartite tricarboxylate transporter TctB family protein [Actinoalloteichus hymeniacidonis]AOS65933.1 Tripartite tricarboxylate transporter TctB family [Actinoalloteichus hymeniacidonis]MBB5905971.1 putative tricarboxylic transport membrane protein [Actinoalloteichus hymeniacidonis]
MNTDTVDTGSRPSFWTGRSGLVVSLLLLALAVFLTHGTITMEVPANVSSPGPKFFPVIVTGLTYLLAVAMAVQVIRFPSPPGAAPETVAEELVHAGEDVDSAQAAEDAASAGPKQSDAAKAGTDYRTYTDWRAVGIVVAAFVAFTVLLTPLGWLISGALLFWGVSYALDGRRPLFDVSVALLVSAIVQLAFSGGLGLNLPPGILGGIF